VGIEEGAVASRPVIQPAGLVALLPAYLALHVGIRLLAPGAAEHDEAEPLVLSQVLALGYGLHPPLYTWLQHGVFAALGGALRLRFPAARILTPAFPRLAVPAPASRLMAVVWRPRGSLAPPARLQDYVAERLPGADLGARPPFVLDVPWAGAARGSYRLAVILLPPAAWPAVDGPRAPAREFWPLRLP
jgi:hypothetical protein